ncbi:lipoprotein, partial [Aeromonas salmonicida subsp. salmonicida]
MRLAFISVVLAALLGGCSSGPAAPTLESGTMVVR